MMGSLCFLLNVQDLHKYRGNACHATKLDYWMTRLQSSNELLEDSEDSRDLPQLVLNCVTGQCILIEGNNRHEAYMQLGREWFPVRVRIDDFKTDFVTGGKRVKNIPHKWRGRDSVAWRRKKLWQEKTSDVLREVFGINVKAIPVSQ